MFSLPFTQAFSPTTTLTLGLFNMFDAASRRPLVGGGGIDSFWNLAMAAPLTNITPPYIYGISLNTRTDVGSFGLFVYDPRDAQDLGNIRDLFSDGVTISGTATFPVTIGGLGGFQNLRLAYSTLDGLDLTSLPPQVGQPPAYKTARWYVQYRSSSFSSRTRKTRASDGGCSARSAIPTATRTPSGAQLHRPGRQQHDGRPPRRPLGRGLLLVQAEQCLQRAARRRIA